MVFLWVVGCNDVDIHPPQPLLASAMLNPTCFAWVPDFKFDEGQLHSVISQGFGVVCRRGLQASLTCRLLNIQLTHLSSALKGQRDLRAATILGR